MAEAELRAELQKVNDRAGSLESKLDSLSREFEKLRDEFVSLSERVRNAEPIPTPKD
jgi:predicted  nucleic acid-binding Zn-ribbon protein